MIEKVNPQHPDKIADRIAGAIVDLAYTKNDNPKVAAEVLLGHGTCTVILETSEDITEAEVAAIVRRIAGELRRFCSQLYDYDNLIVNPLGDWTGGTNVDAGATNRKLGSDMGDGVTGGGLHGKDLSKADVSVNIWCHLQAQRTNHPLHRMLRNRRYRGQRRAVRGDSP